MAKGLRVCMLVWRMHMANMHGIGGAREHKDMIMTTGAHLVVPHMSRVVIICEKGVSDVSQKLAVIGCTSHEYARMREERVVGWG